MRFLPAITSARDLAFSLTDDEARGRLCRPGHTLTEVLKDGAVTKIYLDYDSVLTGRAKDAGPLLESEIEPHMTDVVERLDYMCRVLNYNVRETVRGSRDEGEDAEAKQVVDQIGRDPVSYAISTRHGWCATKQVWKISIRPFFIGVRMRYDHIPHLMRVTAQLDEPGQPSFWDVSVYKEAEQLLACINGIKSGADRRVLVPLPMQGPPIQLLDYVAQHVEDSWEMMVVPADKIARNHADPSALTEGWVSGSVDVPLPTKPNSCVPQPVLRMILGALAARRADDRNTWLGVIWAIQAVSAQNGYGGEGEGMAHDFSKRCEAKYDGRAVSRIYNAGRLDGVSLGSLLRWVKEDNAAAPRVFREIQSALRAAEGQARMEAVRGGGVQFLEDEGDVIQCGGSSW
ncbi:MAG: hypothetical protein WDW38_006659 [Sanguina aurantia]